MLKTRVITAVLLVAALLPSLFFLSQRDWALLMAVVSGLAAWEWGGLLRWRGSKRIAYGLGITLLATGLTVVHPALALGLEARFGVIGYGVAVSFWLLVVPLWLRCKWPAAFGGALTGLVVILPAWMAIVQLRSLGPAALLAILAVVWLADIAAYFSGKAFGRHKLAPTVSPGKTWEGAVGAAIAVVIYGLLMRAWFGLSSIPLLPWVLALLLVTVVSVLGDLLESLLKRQAGLKDSSAILPGHGGILDRIDSLTSTLPTVALLWLLAANGVLE